MDGNKSLSTPKQLFTNALKAVKGENTAELIEQFTSEMTLVAEGICEDQARLHQRLDTLQNGSDQNLQHMESELAALESTAREDSAKLEKKLNDLSERIAALEKKADRKPAKRDKSWIQQLTIPVAIAAAAWVIVTVLNLFK